MTAFRLAPRSSARRRTCFVGVFAGAGVLAACATAHAPSLAPLCSGAPASASLDASIDSVRPPAGPALVAKKGQHFTMRFTFAGDASASAATAGECSGRTGTATMDVALPETIRNAAARSGQAAWRIDGDMVMLDLNPGTRDNNVFVALPLRGGTGHWGLSTFAGEVASGTTRLIP